MNKAVKTHVGVMRVCGAMDNASDYESGDCRFESCQTRIFFIFFLLKLMDIVL